MLSEEEKLNRMYIYIYVYTKAKIKDLLLRQWIVSLTFLSCHSSENEDETHIRLHICIHIYIYSYVYVRIYIYISIYVYTIKWTVDFAEINHVAKVFVSPFLLEATRWYSKNIVKQIKKRDRCFFDSKSCRWHFRPTIPRRRRLPRRANRWRKSALRDMTCSDARHDSLLHATWRIPTCDMTHRLIFL